MGAVCTKDQNAASTAPARRPEQDELRASFVGGGDIPGSGMPTSGAPTISPGLARVSGTLPSH